MYIKKNLSGGRWKEVNKYNLIIVSILIGGYLLIAN
jgi:hypothetical protein